MVDPGPTSLFNVVEKNFHFLFSDLNFSVERKNEDLVNLQSERCEVTIIAANNQVEVSITPFGNIAHQMQSRNLRISSADVEGVLWKLAPQENFKSNFPIKTLQDIDSELKRYAPLIKKYCMKLLAGDLTEWELLYK